MTYLDDNHMRQIDEAAARAVSLDEWRRRKPEWFQAHRAFTRQQWPEPAATELADLHVQLQEQTQ